MNQNKITIVVPVYNSSYFLPNLLSAINIEKLKFNWDLELILVDDGSKDQSFEKIIELTDEYSYIRGIKLSRNFGHQIAVKTGLTYCTGDYIAIIDDDLQDSPSLLSSFFKHLDDAGQCSPHVVRHRIVFGWVIKRYPAHSASFLDDQVVGDFALQQSGGRHFQRSPSNVR